MANILQTTFSKTFPSKKSFVFWFKFHLSLILKVQLKTTKEVTSHNLFEWMSIKIYNEPDVTIIRYLFLIVCVLFLPAPWLWFADLLALQLAKQEDRQIKNTNKRKNNEKPKNCARCALSLLPYGITEFSKHWLRQWLVAWWDQVSTYIKHGPWHFIGNAHDINYYRLFFSWGHIDENLVSFMLSLSQIANELSSEPIMTSRGPSQ